MKSSLELTYISLLADVASLSGFSELRGSNSDLTWCLIEAPKLEKLLLASVESGVEPDWTVFPAALLRLARGSLVDPLLMRYVRQLLLFSYKAYITHDVKTTEKAFEAFITANAEVGRFGQSLSRQSPSLLDKARRHCQSVLYLVRPQEITPRHGPGAVTTSKDRWLKRYSTIDYLYPQCDWFSLYFNRDHCSQLEDSSDEDIISAKLIAVPKDSRGPRLICVHPAEAIWIQQGLRVELERAISLHRRSSGLWPSGHIHFDDQTVNGRIALLSSRSRRYATIDMKEASDRISEPLVQALFGRYYKWFGCCRAQRFVIPRYKTMSNARGELHSYAPMGNATTFPVQSLVFWAICVASLQYHGFHQPGAVFVFGDDIIIPSEAAEVVINDLESFGLLVNRSKSFWRGSFRESCGVDAFKGVNVTPVRWKTTKNAEDLFGLQSLSDIAMRLRIAGYEGAAATAYSELSRMLGICGSGTLFKTNDRNHGSIAEYTTDDYWVWRDAYWHRDTQQYVSPVLQLECLPPRRQVCDWNHVLESVLLCKSTGRGAIPDRTFSRGSRLVRGWTRVE